MDNRFTLCTCGKPFWCLYRHQCDLSERFGKIDRLVICIAKDVTSQTPVVSMTTCLISNIDNIGILLHINTGAGTGHVLHFSAFTTGGLVIAFGD